MEEENEKKAIEIEKNWADLPSDLFPLILKNLPDISDFIRYRAVCKPWHSSSSVADLPLQFPWILNRNEGPDLHFYSMASNKVYTIRPAISSGYRFFGPAGCYMVTAREDNADSFSLRNPLNNCEVALPVHRISDPCIFSSDYCHMSFQTDNYMFISEYKRSVGCKLGGDRWDIIGPGDASQHKCYYVKGLLFRYGRRTGCIEIIDISTCKELYVISQPEEFSKMTFTGPYFVESSGEILVVCYNVPYYNHAHYKNSYKKTDLKFYIHRLEFGNGNGSPSWVKLWSIGDRILFFEIVPLGYGRGFSLRASDYAGFKGNCIYFLNKVSRRYVDDVNVIKMYDIENDETTIIDTPFNQNAHFTWFMPTLNPM